MLYGPDLSQTDDPFSDLQGHHFAKLLLLRLIVLHLSERDPVQTHTHVHTHSQGAAGASCA